MLGIVMGKVMIPGEVFFCAHIKVIAGHIIQNGIDGTNLGQVDRPRRQTSVHVRIVRRVDKLMLVKHAFEREVAHGIYQRRVSPAAACRV